MWDRTGALKAGIAPVFAGATLPDTWSHPAPAVPVIDFAHLPPRTETNLTTFLVAGTTALGHELWLNGTQVSTSSIDLAGNYAFTVPLAAGDNMLALATRANGETLSVVTKTVHVDLDRSTAAWPLLYVDSVAAGSVPSVPGTIIIDLAHDTLLGVIPDKHVVGIAPDGRELYFSDLSVYSTATHQPLRTLAFSLGIPVNGFVVSPDGTRLYARNERLDVASNTLLDNLPLDITRGRGGPAISADGRRIYCCQPLAIVDTVANTATQTTLPNVLLGDITLTPDDRHIMVSEYSYAQGRLRQYDADTLALLGTVGGLGDYTGDVVVSPDGAYAVVGSAGNPAWVADGRLSVVDLATMQVTSSRTAPLADNLATTGDGVVYVSAADQDPLFPRLGVHVYELGPTGGLVLTKTYFLGINRHRSGDNVQHDQVARIVYKP